MVGAPASTDVTSGGLARALEEAARGAAATGPVLWLRPAAAPGPGRAGGPGALVRAWARRRGCPLLSATADSTVPDAFAVARELLPALLTAADPGRPWLADFGPELAALLPGRRGQITAPDLSAIALGGTKRRLHRDSERLFRLVSAFASIAGSGLAELTARSGGPVVLLVEQAEHCDRSSLACLLHLLRTAARPPLLVLASAGPDLELGWPGPAVGPGHPRLAAWTDAAAEQRALLGRFLAAADAAAFTVALSAVGADGADASGGPPAAAAPACCSRPGCADPWHEGAQAVLAYRAVAGGDGAGGAARALAVIQRSFGFTLNYELILLCCRIALASGTAAAKLPALQFAGLAHAYLGHDELAEEIFAAAAAETTLPEARAQLCYYRGLLASKRLGRPDAGRRRFDEGLRSVAGRPGNAARLERGWLRNGLAFVAWRQGRPREAAALIKAALDETADLAEPADGGDPQLVNLRVNLVNNLSVLLEDVDERAAALAAWRTLGVWEEFVGGTFGKSYRYRESWLLLSLGQIGDAYERARMSLAIAADHRDVFHMSLIGTACRYLACRNGDLDAAGRWADEGIRLAAGLGHRAAQARAHGQAAHVRWQAGDHGGALRQLDAGLAVAPDDGLLARARRRLQAGAGPDGALGPDGELAGIRLDRPRPKLTTPFPIAHLITDAAFAAGTHELALGTVRG